MSRCIGCGVKLQSNDPLKKGYLPEIVMLEKGEEVYCKRCHDIRAHNKKYERENDFNDYFNKIKIIKTKKALVLLMIDVMDIYGGFIPRLSEAIGDNKLIVLVNKVDVIPKSIKLKSIEQRVKEIALKQNLNIQSVLLISSKTKDNVHKVVEKIAKLKRPFKGQKKHITTFEDCYVVGCASVGKSTFLNSISELYLNDNKNRLTTSDQFNTTIDFIKIPLDQKDYIIDTPGIINTSSFGAYLDYESVKILTPHTYLKPKTYQLNPDQTIFLGGLVQIDFIEGSNISASFYVSNNLYLHRTKTINSESVYNKNILNLLKPPLTKNEYELIKTNKELIFENNNEVKDLFISGIGFVHISGENVKMRVKLFENININWENTII